MIGPSIIPSEAATSIIANTRDAPPSGPKMPGVFFWYSFTMASTGQYHPRIHIQRAVSPNNSTGPMPVTKGRSAPMAAIQAM